MNKMVDLVVMEVVMTVLTVRCSRANHCVLPMSKLLLLHKSLRTDNKHTHQFSRHHKPLLPLHH